MALHRRCTYLPTIHREVGMAGYLTCEELPAEQRREYLALAAAKLEGGMPAADLCGSLAAMFAATIAASDAVASELSAPQLDAAHRDRLHAVHMHVMTACELLDERLTLLELENAPA